TSSVILSNTLKLIGGDGLVTCYIPDRFTEGYGLSTHIVTLAAEQGFKVILTADIGIKSRTEATLAKEHGIDLIICDHHLPDGEDIPPDAYAVLCPKGSSGLDYPNKDLAACGVALKLSEALLEGHPKYDAIIASLAKLTAIGSIADMVDLANAENRAIVHWGLRALAQDSRNPGLRALFNVAGIKPPITTYDIGFKIGPRINAAGRIAHAGTVLSLFNALTDAEAAQFAEELDRLNAERQQIQRDLVSKLLEQIEQKPQLDRVLLFAGLEEEGFHRGVVGIACSKVVERTGRPTLICAINEEGVAHGSARSIKGFHIVEALTAASPILVKYGGHPMAAGFTVRSDKIEELRWRLNDYAAEKLNDEDLCRTLTADAELTVEETTLTTVRALSRLEPHGIGNPSPIFLLRDVPVRAISVLKEKHLKFYVGSMKKAVVALWWDAVRYHQEIAQADQISLLARLEINNWNGSESVQLKVLDVAVE
ncbi:MAG TPA: single-stranded-DNA-specific exonuclease RecJ, partial [Blastocatellia bacterium]|nr:single-stranded-DNA-specific exonuclease RecJ [Blastocatellia bacterium]